MPNFGISAAALVYLDKHAGTWCSLADMSARLCIEAKLLERVCDDELVAGGLAVARVVDGAAQYGVQISEGAAA